MALTGKKSGNMHNLSGSKKAKLQAKFDENFHDVVTNDPDSNPMLASIVYTLQNVTEDIDSLRTYTDSELKGLISTNTDKTNFPGIGTTSTKCKAGNTPTISNTQANAITTNTSKVTFPFTPILTDAGPTTLAIKHQLNNENKSDELLLTVTIPPAKKGGKAITKSVTLQLK